MFIIDVLGANVVIGLSIFVYLFMMVLLMKFWFPSEFSYIEKGKVTEEWEVIAIIVGIIWPLCLPLYVICKIIKNIAPLMFRFFNKITPTIKIEKEE